MIALISGINGFIGRHLSDALLSRGYKVAGIPRDLFADTEKLTTYLLEAHPDYIFHLGAYGHQKGMDDQDQMAATNILNTYVLLRYSQQLPLKRFVYVGTSSVFGLKGKAIKETDSMEPTTSYAVTKACACLLTRMFPNTTVVHPFSMFGEGEQENRFIPTVIRCLKTGDTMPLVEDSKHDWIYVRDAADAIVIASECNKPVVNIGMGKQYSNLEIVKMLEHISDKKLNYTKVESIRSYDTKYWVSNPTLLNSLGFTPVYGVRCGLKRTYDYY